MEKGFQLNPLASAYSADEFALDPQMKGADFFDGSAPVCGQFDPDASTIGRIDRTA